jgi:hypothetical protein
MKMLKALVATAILGSSTLAVAQPVFRDHRYEDRDENRYEDRDGYSQQFRERRRGPVMLAQNLELDRRQPAFIRLDGRTSQLRFDADDGRVFIDSVVMTFANGQTQTISIRQRLNDRSQPLTINVDGRATGMYIYGMSRRGSLDIVGIRNSSGYQRWNQSRW